MHVLQPQNDPNVPTKRQECPQASCQAEQKQCENKLMALQKQVGVQLFSVYGFMAGSSEQEGQSLILHPEILFPHFHGIVQFVLRE